VEVMRQLTEVVEVVALVELELVVVMLDQEW
jgi:hypothetical protein